MTLSKAWQLIIGGVLFDLYWSLAAFQQDKAIILLWVLALLAFIFVSNSLKIVIFFSTIAGVSMDWCWVKLGIFHFNLSQSIPLWIVALWLAFCTFWQWLLVHVNWSLKTICFMGAVLGPFTYWFATHTGAIHFDLNPLLVLLILSFSWAIYLPLISMRKRI